MAKLNNEVLIDTEENRMQCSMSLQACLSEQELERLRKQWNLSGMSIPWWKYALDNISVHFEDYDGEDFFCPGCGSIVVVDHGAVACEECGWQADGDELGKYV